MIGITMSFQEEPKFPFAYCKCHNPEWQRLMLGVAPPWSEMIMMGLSLLIVATLLYFGAPLASRR